MRTPPAPQPALTGACRFLISGPRGVPVGVYRSLADARSALEGLRAEGVDVRSLTVFAFDRDGARVGGPIVCGATAGELIHLTHLAVARPIRARRHPASW